MFCIALHEIEKSPLRPALRRKDFHFVSRAFRQRRLQQIAILEIRRNVNRFRQILRLQVKLLQKRRHKLLRIKLLEFFPIEFPAIHYTPAAQVEKVRTNQRRLGLTSKNLASISM